MSMSFYISPKNSWLKKHKVITLETALDLSTDELIECEYVLTEKEWQQHAHQPISELGSLRIAKPGYSARGFELAYNQEQNIYVVRVNTPSSIEDWEIALQYIQQLSRYIKGSITSEEGEKFSDETIIHFDFNYDINAGINSILSLTEEDKENTELTIYGYIRPVVFNEQMVMEIKNAHNPALTFGNIVRSIQDLDAYNANPIGLYKEDSELTIAYVIGEKVPTIIPLDPSYNINTEIKDEVVHYIVTLCYGGQPDREEKKDPDYGVREIDYQQFIKALTDDQYIHIDGMHILVNPMNKGQMIALQP